MDRVIPGVRIPGVQFQPWVGTRYRGQRQRVLVVSGYFLGDEAECRKENESDTPNDVTATRIIDHLEGKRIHKFFTMVATTITCTNADFSRTNRDIWDNIAYCNLIQRLFVYPEDHHTWINYIEPSRVAFQLILDALKPTHLIFFGKRIWEAALAPEECVFNGGKAPVLALPSTAYFGFSPRHHFEAVANFLDHPIMQNEDH